VTRPTAHAGTATGVTDTGGSPPAPVTPATSTATSTALYDVDPDAVAALVVACPAVGGLSAGPFGAAATYLPGRRVSGVRLERDVVEAHVVLRYGATVAELAGQIRRALSGQVKGRRVDIVVEDVLDRADPSAAVGRAHPPAGAARPLPQPLP